MLKTKIFIKGKELATNANRKNSGENVCLKLTERYAYFNRKRCLTADNFFSSVPLANKLLEKNISYVGTLRKNKTEIPMSFLPNRQRSIFSSLFGFNEDKTIVSYVPKVNKAVILLSTEHHNKTLSNKDSKPEIIQFYNKNKVCLGHFISNLWN